MVQISPKFFLIVGSPGEVALLNGCPAITGELLKKPSSFEEILWLYLRWSDVESVGIPKQLCDLLGTELGNGATGTAGGLGDLGA